jgi:hypothetical protein
MTRKQLIAAREKLGRLAGLDRPLHKSELGRALRLLGRDPGKSVNDWERRGTITGPASVAIELMLAGAQPPDGWEAVLRQPMKKPPREG